MPSADKNSTTPSIGSPHGSAVTRGATLPSIADLGELRRHIEDASNYYGQQALEAARSRSPEEESHDLASKLAFDRGNAVIALALTLRARTLPEAAEQLGFVMIQVDRLSGVADAEQVSREVREIWRGIASVLPVVADAAGTTAEGLIGPAFAAILQRHMPELVEGTR